MLVTRWF